MRPIRDSPIKSEGCGGGNFLPSLDTCTHSYQLLLSTQASTEAQVRTHIHLASRSSSLGLSRAKVIGCSSAVTKRSS